MPLKNKAITRQSHSTFIHIKNNMKQGKIKYYMKKALNN